MATATGTLAGKVAIVTGGGTGIGRAIALELAGAGADVALAGRRRSFLEEAAEEIKALGRRSLAIPTDISKKPDVDNLVRKVIAEFGVIDILINNAGIIPRGPLLEMPEDAWDELFNIDLKGFYLCSQAIGKRMVERGQGNIVNIASAAAFKASAAMPAYSIAKAGVAMLTGCLAVELGQHGIRVNAIAPGLIKVKRNQFLWGDPAIVERVENSTPLGRLGETSDIARVALFLASDAAGYITGHTIVADGGTSA